MRTFLTASFAILTLASPVDAATRNFGITSFEKVRIEGPYKITLTTGVAPFARATGPAPALDRIAIDVRGNVLVVHNNISAWGSEPSKAGGQVEISLGTHDLSAAWLTGAGTLAINQIKGLSFDLSSQGSGGVEIGRVDVDQLNVGVIGTARAVLAGKVGTMKAVVRGVSSLDGSELATKDATIAGEGAATISAQVSNAVTIDGNGPVAVTLTGDPACTLRLHGSASVSGCR